MLALCTLAAAALLGYLALSRPTVRGPAGAARLLIADSSLPDPRQRVLDELTIEQTAAAPATFTLQRRRPPAQPGFYLSPPGSRADEAEVETLFSALLSAVVERRLDDAAAGPQPGPTGNLAGPCRVRVRFGAGHTLCFGAESASGSVYVRADDSPVVLVVARTLFALLARPPSHYRASQMVPLPLRRAQKLVLGKLHLVHDGDLWRVQGPDGTWQLADPVPVEELVQRLIQWKVRAWPAAPRSEPPAPPLALRVDGEELWRGGWPAPADCPPATRLFIRAPKEPVCADDPARQELLPASAALRAQVLLPTKTTAVARLQVAPRVSLVRLDDGTYAQSGRPAETTSVGRILALLTTARTEAVAEPLRPAATAARLQVTTTLGQKVELALWTQGEESFVQRDQEAPQRLTEPVAELFTLDELTFAPLQLLTLESAAVRRLTRRFPTQKPPENTEVVERTAGWQLRQPTAAPASSAAVATLLEVLSDLRALRWASSLPRPEHGLSPPRARIEVELGGPLPPARNETADRGNSEAEKESPAHAALTIELGAPADARGSCYARRAAGPAVAILPAASCAALTQSLLSPWLLRLDETRLTTLRLTQSPPRGGELACTAAAGRWRCGDKELSAAAQRSLLTALQALGRSESFTYAAAPWAPPQLTLYVRHQPLTDAMLPRATALAAVTLGEEVAPAEQTLRLYADGAAGWVARLEDRAVSYRLPQTTAAAVTEALAALGLSAP